MEEKLEEVRGACWILGFDDVRDLGFEDDDILLTQEKIDAIADMIRQVKLDRKQRSKNARYYRPVNDIRLANRCWYWT